MPLPEDINPKVNIIAWLEIELVYYNVAVPRVCNYNTGTPR